MPVVCPFCGAAGYHGSSCAAYQRMRSSGDYGSFSLFSVASGAPLSIPSLGMAAEALSDPVQGDDDDYETNLRIQAAMGGDVKKAVSDVDAAAPVVEPDPTSAPQTCVICMCEPAGRVRRGKACGHEFCAGCIETWLAEHTTCPVCVADLSVHGGYRLVDEGGPTTDLSELMFRIDAISAILGSLGV